VLESKHVIGLFLLMLVFSGVFFSLGYVMGRNQYDGHVSAENNAVGRTEPVLSARPDIAPKKTVAPPAESADADPATAPGSDSPWKFEENSKAAKAEPRLEPVPKAAPTPPPARSAKSGAPVAVPAPRPSGSKPLAASSPLIPNGAYVLQVAALARQDDALALAGSLQKKRFAAYVQTPQKDKFFRVQVGPFKDQKSADAAKKGLESAGFKAFYVKH